MSSPIDLVQKSQVENFLSGGGISNFNPTSDSVLIPSAITAISQDWLNQTGRRTLNRFLPLNDFFDGSGSDRQFLRDFPAFGVSGVYIYGNQVPQGNNAVGGNYTAGWVLDQKRESVSLIGYNWRGYSLGLGVGSGGAYAAYGGPMSRQYIGASFGRNDNARQAVNIQYFAGGTIMFGETVQIPDASPYQVTVSQSGFFYGDLGVIYSLPQNGLLTPLEAVTGTPTQGQYSVASTGVYTFSAADAGQYVAIDYGYNLAPPDVQEYAIIQIAETLQKRKFLSVKSSGSPETGTTTYTWDVCRPPIVQATMLRYRRAMVGM